MDTIELESDDALVLFELLSRHDELDNENEITSLQFEDSSERLALWQVLAGLKETLVEPFDSGYKILVDEARKSVRCRWGMK